MKSKVAPFAATPDPTFGRRSAPKPKKGQAGGEIEAARAESPDQRLLIEEDEATGAFVYRTIDRRTGQVLQELARDELLRLSDDDGYAAGGVIRTKA